MSTDASQWLPPRWASRDYGKHLPRYGEDWVKTKRTTIGPRGVARYHPSLTHADIERLEMSLVGGLPDGLAPGVRAVREIQPSPRRNERIFLARIDRIAGACQGEDTSLIYVIYNRSGPVHGYPISETEAARLGAIP